MACKIPTQEADKQEAFDALVARVSTLEQKVEKMERYIGDTNTHSLDDSDDL